MKDTEQVLIVEKSERIATITLNRPASLNALSRELITAISDAFASLKEDPSIDVLILTGAGRAFCAGLDLKELAAGENFLAGSHEEGIGTNLANPLKDFGKPIIGAINGFAITGGFELALACDILVASMDARFADTHVRVGIMPGSELSQKLSRLIGIYRAKEISLTGNYIDAQQAYDWGLVNRVVEPDQLLPAARAIAGDILSCPPDMVRKYKKLIDDGFAVTFKDGIALEQNANREHFRSVQPELIAQRRKTVLERGRKQKE